MAVPADHSVTVNKLGKLAVVKMIVKAILNYRHTIFYLFRRGKFTDLYNFFYTKTLVPTGEGSGELVYYAIAGVLQRHPNWAPYPKYIEIEVTTRCNKRCTICEHTWWDEKQRDLSYRDFVSLVEQFNLRWVNLTGEGDAFLNRSYLKMIEYLKRKGVSVYLTDSLDLVTPAISDELVRLGVDGLYVSMDGATKKTYEDIKVGCDFDSTLYNLKGLLAAKRRYKSPLPEICFRYTITNTNVHEMADFTKLVSGMASRVEWGGGSKIHFIGLLDYPEVHKYYLETVPQEHLDALANTHSDIPPVLAHLEDSSNPNINRCLAWMEPYLALEPFHMALPCCAVMMANERTKLAEYCFGDYTRESFRDLWNHPYYKWFRSAVTKPNGPVPLLCAGCRAYDTTKRVEKYGIDQRSRRHFE